MWLLLYFSTKIPLLPSSEWVAQSFICFWHIRQGYILTAGFMANMFHNLLRFMLRNLYLYEISEISQLLQVHNLLAFKYVLTNMLNTMRRAKKKCWGAWTYNIVNICLYVYMYMASFKVLWRLTLMNVKFFEFLKSRYTKSKHFSTKTKVVPENWDL